MASAASRSPSGSLGFGHVPDPELHGFEHVPDPELQTAGVSIVLRHAPGVLPSQRAGTVAGRAGASPHAW